MTSPTPLGDGTPTSPHDPVPPSRRGGVLDLIERVGNSLPDPAALFLILLFVVWSISALLAPMQFAEIDPRSDAPSRVKNMLAPAALASFLGRMVTIFTGVARAARTRARRVGARFDPHPRERPERRHRLVSSDAPVTPRHSFVPTASA